MKTQILLLTCLSLFLLNSCEKSLLGIKGKGAMETNTPNISGTIQGVDASVDATILYIKSDTDSVSVRAQQNIYENMEFDTHGGVLYIEFDKRVRNHDGITIEIYASECRHAHISGSGEIYGNGLFKTDQDVSVKISGSGDVTLNVEAPEIQAHISGSGEISLQGSVYKTDIDISGSGDVKASDLQTEKCSVDIAGSGNVSIAVSDKLSVKISGSGDVYYKGSPSISTDISGSGDIVHL